MSEELPRIDLADFPFTDADSRLLVLQSGDGLSISTAEYLRPVERSRAMPHLEVRAADGEACPVRSADAAAIHLDRGPSVTFAEATTLSIGFPPGGWQVQFRLAGPPVLGDRQGTASTDLNQRRVRWRIEAEQVTQTFASMGGDPLVRIDITDGSGGRIVLSVGQSGSLPAAPHDALVAAARERWHAWFSKMPRLRPDLQVAGRLAWWVMRANSARVGHNTDARSVVVPSKLGYVGAWQWDSYFVSVGLRHGAPDLAWEQIEAFLDHQLADGMIPDVFTDAGVLASSVDLPADDPSRGVVSPMTGEPVPITKPPLPAWALAHLNRFAPDADRTAWARQRILAAQRWWTQRNDLDGGGLAEYLHPYSSGLDDSPLFDHGGPVEPPDLNSYLALQDDLLGDLAAEAGDRPAAERHRHLATERIDRMLATRWNGSAGRFASYAQGRPVEVFTPLHLMPLLTGRLPTPVTAAIVESMLARLWGDRPLPTVAPDEPVFNPERMWRGPVWVNINRLVAEGLLVSGRSELARELAERTLSMVVESGSFYEYWNPLTGTRPASATTSFAWSAALFLDLAVAVTDDLGVLAARRL